MIPVLYKRNPAYVNKDNVSYYLYAGRTVQFLEHPREWKEYVRHEQSCERWYA